MSLSKKVKPAPKEKKVKSKGTRKSGKSNLLPTKIIIRHLPPNLTSEQFLNKISPVPEHSYYYFVEADSNLGEFSYSRAYIDFINQDDILIFKEKFDNFIFLDDKGNEYTAIVELALYQGAPRNKKNDVKFKSIENDSNYLNFVKSLENINKEEFNLPSVENCLEEIEAKARESKNDNNVLTPLLEYIRDIEIEKKSKDFTSDASKKNNSEEKKKNSYFKSKSRSKKWQNESNPRSSEKESRRKFKRNEKDSNEKKSFKTSTEKKNQFQSNKNDRETVYNVKILSSKNSDKYFEKEYSQSKMNHKTGDHVKKETTSRKPVSDL